MKVTRFTKWFIYIINNCDFSVSASYRKFWLEDLKGILSELVSENQAAYIPGRHITDNVVLAHEAFHALKVQKRCSTNYTAVKTDVSKSYDRLE